MDPWIARRIFPGSYSPTLEEMVGILSPLDFAVLDVEDLRLHYERTLEHWLERFEKNTPPRSSSASTRASCACGACTSPARSRRSTPATCSSGSSSFAPRARERDPVDARAPVRAPRPSGVRCDVLVVGGGPAGSTCARALERAGLRAAVLDAKRVPARQGLRGLDHAADRRELELDLRGLREASRVLQPIRGFEVSLRGRHERAGHLPRGGELRHPPLRVRRVPAGALRRGAAPRRAAARRWSATARRGSRTATCARRSWSARAGTSARSRAQLAPATSKRDRSVIAAQEVEFELDAEQAARLRGVARGAGALLRARPARLRVARAQGPVLNVGIGRQDPHDLSGHAQRFLAFCESRGKLPPRTPPKRHGHAYLLYGQTPRPLAGDGFVLIGDSAGLAWPQSGEGIRPAVESGLLAARAIAAKDLRRLRARDRGALRPARAGRATRRCRTCCRRACARGLAEKLLATPRVRAPRRRRPLVPAPEPAGGSACPTYARPPGERSVSSVISAGANRRIGGPQKPVPRLT